MRSQRRQSQWREERIFDRTPKRTLSFRQRRKDELDLHVLPLRGRLCVHRRMRRERAASLSRTGLGAGELFRLQCLQSSEASLACTKAREGEGEIGLVELGPHALGEVQLGIGALPEEEIGEAFLAAR